MEKEKALITSFVVANFVDTAITSFGLELPGFREIGVLAGSHFVEIDLTQSALVKAGVVACLVGIYALAKTNQSRLEMPLEKTLEYGNIIVWGMAMLNIAQISWEIFH